MDNIIIESLSVSSSSFTSIDFKDSYEIDQKW
jgi:hypothetical protein